MHHSGTYYISSAYTVDDPTSEEGVQEKENNVQQVTSSNETVTNNKGNEAQGTETIEQDSTMHFDVVITQNNKETDNEQLVGKANGKSFDESKGKVININEEDQAKMMESSPKETVVLTPILQKSNKGTESDTNNLGVNPDDSIPLEESLNTSVDWETCDEELSDSSDTSDEEDVIAKRTNTKEDDESSDHEVILKESTMGTDSIDMEGAQVEVKDSIEDAGKIENSGGSKESRTDEVMGIGVTSADYTREWETFQEDKDEHNISDEEIVFRKESHETTNPDECETNENKSSSEASNIQDNITTDESRIEAVEIQNADLSSQWETFEEEAEDHSPTAEDEEVVIKAKPNNALSLREQGTEDIQGSVTQIALFKAEFQDSAQSIDAETFEQEKESRNDFKTQQEVTENNSVDKQNNNIQADDHTEKDERCSGNQIQTDYGNVLNTTTDWETCDESDTSCDSNEDIDEDMNDEKANNEDDDTEEGKNLDNTNNEYREKDKNMVMDRSSESETCDESDTSCDSTDEIKEKKTASEDNKDDKDKADDEVATEETDNTENVLRNHREQKSLNASFDWETCESDTSCDTTDETNDKAAGSAHVAVETKQHETINDIQRNNYEHAIVNTSSDWDTVNESFTSLGSTDEINDKTAESEEAAIGTDQPEITSENQRNIDEHAIVKSSSDWETVNESYTSFGSTDEINDKTTESEDVSIETEQPEITNTFQRNSDEHAIVNTSSDSEPVNESDTSCNTTDDIDEKSTIDRHREKRFDEAVLDLERSQLVVKEAEGHESKEHQCLKTVSKIEDEKVQEVNENSNKNNTDQNHNREEKSDGSRIGKDPECRGMILSNAFKNDLSEEWQCLRQTMLCSLQFYTEERFSAKLLHPSPCFNLLFNALLW